jgi:hypothetical protein
MQKRSGNFTQDRKDIWIILIIPGPEEGKSYLRPLFFFNICFRRFTGIDLKWLIKINNNFSFARHHFSFKGLSRNLCAKD